MQPPLRIPAHPPTHSDNIRPPIPGYPATCDALPRGSFFPLSGLRVFVIHFGDGFSHGRPLEFEAVGVMDDAIEDSIGEGRLTDDVMPSLDG